MDRARLLAEPDRQLSADQQARLKILLNKRAQHIPLAYIRGKTEFYGREFVITPAVLEPRPESEAMIDLLKSIDKLPTQAHIADIGCGSGALGITALLEMPKSQVEMVDIDQKAVKVAKLNVDKYTLNIKVGLSDLLQSAADRYDVLLANLPYVPDDFKINLAASHEPRLAIYGGIDGLEVYRRLFDQTSRLAIKPLYILTESLPTQQAGLSQIAAKSGYHEVTKYDFVQLYRCTQN